ncbi:hypothetical protein [Paraburkholderia sp. EG304]|uniref:hypothetical protein n=1 Tax=Paraburkholderia sp. EG304 TaxID=3237015 RepID=UPI00397B2C3F
MQTVDADGERFGFVDIDTKRVGKGAQWPCCCSSHDEQQDVEVQCSGNGAQRTDLALLGLVAGVPVTHDLDTPDCRSVTNAAEAVVAAVLAVTGRQRPAVIVYRDRMGRFDGLLVGDGDAFAGYLPLDGARSYDEALALLRTHARRCARQSRKTSGLANAPGAFPPKKTASKRRQRQCNSRDQPVIKATG